MNDKELKILLTAGLPFLASIFLLIFIIRFGFGKITEAQNSVKKAKTDQLVLEQKLTALTDLGDSISVTSNIASAALPGSNPALAAITQVKKLAINNGVIISNLKASGEITEKSGIKRVDVSFDLEGARSSVLATLDSLSKIAPISLVEKAKLNEIGGAAKVGVTIKSFWADLPTKLPKLTEKVNSLTVDESKSLQELGLLDQPDFVEVPPNVEGARTDPFVGF